MFKNLTVGKKIGLGFGAVLTALAVVVVLSFTGVGGIVGDAEEVIYGNSLDAEITQKEVDHLNWINQVNELLTNDEVTRLEVQMDPAKCAFGQWLNSDARKDAERRIPALKAILAEIEEPHAHLHESAREIGDCFRQADAELPGILAAREVDHLHWATKIRDCFLVNCDSLKVETDPSKCALGKWLASEQARKAYRNGDAEFKATWDKMVASHDKLHRSAQAICETYRQVHPGLVLQLRDIVQAHTQWAGTVSAALAREAGGLYTYQKQVHSAVEQAISVLADAAKDGQTLDEEARKALALKTLEGMRYGQGNKEYFFVIDSEPKVVMHPIKPELEGKPCGDMTDPKGKPFFAEMAQVAKTHGQGFVMYDWPRPGRTEATPKISYVQRFAKWDLIVGTGVYLNDEDAALLARAADFAAGKPFHLGVQTDPTKCGLGRWLAEPETAELLASFPELRAAIDRVRRPHEKLHRHAATIEEKVTACRMEDALHEYHEQVEPLLATLEENLDEAIEAEEKLLGAQQHAKAVFNDKTLPLLTETLGHMEHLKEVAENQLRGMKQANNIYATKTVPSLRKTQELLHQVRNTVRDSIMTQEQMLSTAQGTQMNVGVIGTIGIILGCVLAVVISVGIIKALKRIIDGLTTGSQQTSAAASQVSSASQSLASGTSEQAASIQETSASIEEMSSMTNKNAENAQEASGLASSAQQTAQKGTSAMQRMSAAIDDIKKSSDETAKIIKTIDDIAFQTNLLALNAAVEAARAGEAGKGFAVVAEEVRNLAQRSAEAARSTSEMIEGAVKKADNGVDISREVAEALNEIAEVSTRVNDLVGEIAAASKEQAQGIQQVNTAVSEMDGVTQRNAANAEESASAAEELNAQAEELNNMVAELQIMVGGVGSVATSSGSGKGFRAQPTETHTPTGGSRAGQGGRAATAKPSRPGGGQAPQTSRQGETSHDDSDQLASF